MNFKIMGIAYTWKKLLLDIGVAFIPAIFFEIVSALFDAMPFEINFDLLIAIFKVSLIVGSNYYILK